MRYLLILQSLCAEMHGLANWLARQPETEVLLALERSNHYPDIPGADRIILKRPEHRAISDSLPSWLITAMHKAEKAAYSLKPLAEGSRKPDLILAYSSNGIGFNPRATFPEAFVVNYLCDLSAFESREKEAAALLEDMQTRQADLALAFQGRPKATGAEYVPFIVDTGFFAPSTKNTPKNRLDTVFWLKDADEGVFSHWLHTFAAMLKADSALHIHVLAPNIRFIHIGNEFLAANWPGYASRMAMSCFPHRNARKELFSRASLFVNPSNTLNLDLLEAMSCGVSALGQAPDPFPGRFPLPKRPDAGELLAILRNAAEFALPGNRGREYVVKYHSEDAAAPIHIDKIRAAMAERKKRLERPNRVLA